MLFDRMCLTEYMFYANFALAIHQVWIDKSGSRENNISLKD